MPLRPRVPVPTPLLLGALATAVLALPGGPLAVRAVAATARKACTTAARQDATLATRLAAHEQQLSSLRAAAELAARTGRPAEGRALRVAAARVEVARSGAALERARLADRCAPWPTTAATVAPAAAPTTPTTTSSTTPVTTSPATPTVPAFALVEASPPDVSVVAATTGAAGATGVDPCASTRRSAQQLARQAASLRTRAAQAQARGAAAAVRGRASTVQREAATVSRLVAEAERIQAAADRLTCVD